MTYKCTFLGCNKTSNSPRDRCKHPSPSGGFVYVEMRKEVNVALSAKANKVITTLASKSVSTYD